MLDSEPLAGPEEVREALIGSADPIPPFGPCALGGGLVEAVGAVEAIGGGPVGTPEECEPPDAGGQVFVAPGTWGTEQPPSPAPSTPTQTPEPQPTSVAPSTAFAKHPPKIVRIGGSSVRLVFRFRSDQAGVSFVCKVDRAPFRSCGPTLARRFRLGSHVVRVKARSSAGLIDPTPAVFRFRVVRK